jgi:hypothetical protein
MAKGVPGPCSLNAPSRTAPAPPHQLGLRVLQLARCRAGRLVALLPLALHQVAPLHGCEECGVSGAGAGQAQHEVDGSVCVGSKAAARILVRLPCSRSLPPSLTVHQLGLCLAPLAVKLSHFGIHQLLVVARRGTGVRRGSSGSGSGACWTQHTARRLPACRTHVKHLLVAADDGPQLLLGPGTCASDSATQG